MFVFIFRSIIPPGLMNSPVDEVNRKILQNTKDAHTKISHGQIGQKEIGYRTQSPGHHNH